MNLPNKITVFRVCLIPFFVVFMLLPDSVLTNGNYIALGIFIVAALTDAVDGYIARKHHMVTDFGKFMDPLADKLLVSAALLIFIEQGSVPAWVVIIIISREFIISGFRLVAANRNIVIAASMWAKVKTTMQMIMCLLFIVNFDLMVFNVAEQIAMYLSLLLTVVSLVDYLYKNRSILAEGTK